MHRISAVICVASLSLFILFFSVKLAILYKDIKIAAGQLLETNSLLQKLSDKTKNSTASYQKAYRFMLDGVASIELLSILQDSKNGSSNLNIVNIYADRDILAVKYCYDAEQEHEKFIGCIKKSNAFVSVTDSKDENSSGEEQLQQYTVTMKLNSMRSVLENNPQLKEEN